MPAANKPFKDQIFAFSGKLSLSHKEYHDLIKAHGGAVATVVTGSTSILVSTEDEVKIGSVKVATALAQGTPIVQEGFVGASIAAKKMLSPEFFLVKGKKRKAAKAPAAPAKPKKKARVVLSETLSVIDKSGLADKAAVVTEELTKAFGKASVNWDVELVLNDPEKGKDKYYNMQLLANRTADSFWVVQHWGRTGLEGRVNVEGPFEDIDVGKRVFKRKYRQRTGNSWGQVDASFVESPGKYRLLTKESKEVPRGAWQFYQHNKVDGKIIGWYDYQEEAAKNMEKYWNQYNSNAGLGVRVVNSDYFKYEVNFTEMIQTNTKSGMRRVIRRVPAGEKPSPAAPEKIPDPVKPAVARADESSDEDMGDDGEDEDEASAEEEDVAEEPKKDKDGAEKTEAAEEKPTKEKPAKEEAAVPARGAKPVASSGDGRVAKEADAVSPKEAAASSEAAAPSGSRVATETADAADAATEAGTPPPMEEEETVTATLPLGAVKRRAPP
mmetsp:Transcript_41157/g.95333  ORF Transcript_41157/g.95333 Transcript_41157/m.95333 type:complete len:497 (+) Transcript_41157:73-1563(+)